MDQSLSPLPLAVVENRHCFDAFWPLQHPLIPQQQSCFFLLLSLLQPGASLLAQILLDLLRLPVW
jgi:hypothetical protein